MSSFYYSEDQENAGKETINKYLDLFESYYENPPSLDEALSEMYTLSNVSKIKVKDLVYEIISCCEKKMEDRKNEINNKYTNITKQEAIIICSYTYECDDKSYSPYKILNKNLVSQNRKNGLKIVSKYFFIFLQALRKLPKYFPDKESGYLYRCINKHINYKIDPFDNKSIPYIVGNKKTFWSFTSTSVNLATCINFLETKSEIKSGTIFTLYGDVWGYDITLFNYFNEEEILLEPEREFLVEQIYPPINEVIHIRCKVEKSPLVLSNDSYQNDNYNNKNINIIQSIASFNINTKNEIPTVIAPPKEELKCLEGKNHQFDRILGECIYCHIIGCENNLNEHNFNKLNGKCNYCHIIGCQNNLLEHNFNKYSGKCNFCKIIGCQNGFIEHNFNSVSGRCNYCQLLSCEKGIHNFTKYSGKCSYCQIIGCRKGLREHNYNKYSGKCDYCGQMKNNNS